MQRNRRISNPHGSIIQNKVVMHFRLGTSRCNKLVHNDADEIESASVKYLVCFNCQRFSVFLKVNGKMSQCQTACTRMRRRSDVKYFVLYIGPVRKRMTLLYVDFLSNAWIEDRAGDTTYTTSDAQQTHTVRIESRKGEHGCLKNEM